MSEENNNIESLSPETQDQNMEQVFREVFSDFKKNLTELAQTAKNQFKVITNNVTALAMTFGLSIIGEHVQNGANKKIFEVTESVLHMPLFRNKLKNLSKRCSNAGHRQVIIGTTKMNVILATYNKKLYAFGIYNNIAVYCYDYAKDEIEDAMIIDDDVKLEKSGFSIDIDINAVKKRIIKITINGENVYNNDSNEGQVKNALALNTELNPVLLNSSIQQKAKLSEQQSADQLGIAFKEILP